MSLMWSPSMECFVADTPNIDFERNDGAVFSFDKVNTASVVFEADTEELKSSQSRVPEMIVDKGERIQMTFESSEFSMDVLNASYVEADKSLPESLSVLESGRYEVGRDLTILLPFEVERGSVRIRDLEETASLVSEGTFVVLYLPAGITRLTGIWEIGANGGVFRTNDEAAFRLLSRAEEVRLRARVQDFEDPAEVPVLTGLSIPEGAQTVIELDEEDADPGDRIRIHYKRVMKPAAVTRVTNWGTVARGSLSLHLPLSNEGMAQIGWLHIHFYLVAVTQVPPRIQANYKSAQTFGLTFTVLNPMREDGTIYDYAVEWAKS